MMICLRIVMRTTALLSVIAIALVISTSGHAHDLASGEAHPHYDFSVKPPEAVAPQWFLVQADAGPVRKLPVPGEGVQPAKAPKQAAPFEAFAPRVSVHWDERFLFVESYGMPAHNMMVGITDWQQQVPLPQNYTGTNAWRIPLTPVPAKDPLTIKGRFLRGAIALAPNGIPIFNPQNNRGEISAEIGELDQWGGHCGRADDYHYHAAPLHLQTVLGKDKPIAYALDGYAIYGLTEPDGSQPAGLDAFNGHTTAIGYHYHASTKYPYVNGGFHGEVTEAGGQVDPQPSAQPAREAGAPLRGAKITAFEAAGKDAYKLSYDVGSEKRAILYAVNADGTLSFEYQNGSNGITKQNYTRRELGGERPRPPHIAQLASPAAQSASAPQVSNELATIGFVLRSSVVQDGGALPEEFTGDGKGSTLPLEWTRPPAGTKSYAVIMHHIDHEGKTKWYWTLYNIPPQLTGLPMDVQGIGTLGSNSINREIGYAPPHSKGPGAKTYTLTVYALSDMLQITAPAAQVSRDFLLNAMKGKVLAKAELRVVYSRKVDPAAQNAERRPQPRNRADGNPPPRPPRDTNRLQN